LAAARQSDQMNPERRSSGSQFYIVQGKVIDDEEIKQTELGMLGQKRQDAGNAVFQPYVDSLRFYQSANDSIRFMNLYNMAAGKANAAAMAVDSVAISPDVKIAYKAIGGTPMLDGTYTVFGEVIDGLEVIDKIAKVAVDGNSRPLENVIMWVEVVK
jgi:cyclophilin family peptidyl-prolyl cis-trans isomerase